MPKGPNRSKRFVNLTGFVLAGGLSRRMGRPKQEMLLCGEPMLSRQIHLLRSLCGSIGVVGGSPPQNGEDYFFCDDEWPGRGPLGGIFTGLEYTRTEYNLFVGCDMPFLTPVLLRYISAHALAVGADVTVPESPGRRVQPLCAVYRRRARAAIRMSLMRGENKTSGFYSRVCCSVIRWRELSRAGFRPEIFTNMNTPQDFAAARILIEARSDLKAVKLD